MGISLYQDIKASLSAQWERILLTMQDLQDQFLSQEDPLEKEMATHFNILYWESPWTKESDGLQSMRSQKESDVTQWLNNNNIKSLIISQSSILMSF